MLSRQGQAIAGLPQTEPSFRPIDACPILGRSPYKIRPRDETNPESAGRSSRPLLHRCGSSEMWGTSPKATQ